MLYPLVLGRIKAVSNPVKLMIRVKVAHRANCIALNIIRSPQVLQRAELEPVKSGIAVSEDLFISHFSN